MGIAPKDAEQVELRASYEALHEQIRLEVAANRTLSRIVTTASNCSLLFHVCLLLDRACIESGFIPQSNC